MKPLFFCLLFTAGLVGCKPTSRAIAEEAPGASFKQGHGVKIPVEMQRSLGVEVLDVTEQKISPQLEISLTIVRGSDAAPAPLSSEMPIEASGWITADQAAALKPGQPGEITAPDGRKASCVVRRVEKSADAALGDFEIVVDTTAALDTGTTVAGTFETPPTAEVVAVPASAVMRTAEGEFVYAANEDHFKRVAVQTGARSAHAVEIKDGLYAGDQIVSAQVIPIWMTELQTLRAGQSCCKGH